MLSLSVNKWGFTDKLFENTTCPEEGGFSRIKSHSVRQRLTGIAEGLTKKCGVLRGMMQHRIGLSRTTCMSVFGVYR